MKTKLILPLVLLLVSLTASAQKISEYKPQIDAVEKMFATKDVSAIAGVINDPYTINKVFPGTEVKALPQILQQLPDFDSYQIISETKEKDGVRLKVDFFIKDYGMFAYATNFLILDSNKKIAELNVLEGAQVDTKLPTAQN
ncbi:hypothetical protein ACLI1A_14395 [Flavobacterium sp. RHBU_3]|uniref:hypothetical protein n=1 Tax=Flavobacterium sp. RHBU_3 TaxID=3391184 RepID=UPI0039855991